MRNHFPGICYRCHKPVAIGEGHFERMGRIWRTQHATCAIEHRGEPDPSREAFRHLELLARAKMTGKKGQRARQELNRQNAAIDKGEF